MSDGQVFIDYSLYSKWPPFSLLIGGWCLDWADVTLRPDDASDGRRRWSWCGRVEALHAALPTPHSRLYWDPGNWVAT